MSSVRKIGHGTHTPAQGGQNGRCQDEKPKKRKMRKEVSERGPRTKDKGQDLLMSLDLSRGANQISRPKDF